MLRLMPRIAAVFRGGDDRMLSGIAALFEEGGVRIVGVGEVAPDILVPLGTARPSRAVAARPCRYRSMASSSSLRSARSTSARRSWSPTATSLPSRHPKAPTICSCGSRNCAAKDALTKPRGVGVLVKAPKPGQDRRFDLPAIGPRTIENVARAGLGGSRSLPAAPSSPSPTRSAPPPTMPRFFYRRWACPRTQRA